MNTRFLGIVCILGSIIWVVDNIRWVVLGLTEFDMVSTSVNMIWAIGAICAIVAMIRLNVVGENPIARALACVPIIGFVALILGDLMLLSGFVTADANPLIGIGWLFQPAGMVIVGILTIAAKTWQGWRRFVPLFCTISIPVGFALSAMAGGNAALAVPLVAVTWVLLGCAVVTAEPVAVQRPALA